MADEDRWQDQEVDTDVMLVVQDNIGIDMIELGQRLRIQPASLQYVELDTKPYGSRRTVMKILESWKNREVQAATIRILVNHLKAMERNDIVRKIMRTCQERNNKELTVREVFPKENATTRTIRIGKEDFEQNVALKPRENYQSYLPSKRLPWRVDPHCVVLPTKTKFGIIMVDGKTKLALPMHQISNGPVVAVFPKDDVDFSIYVDNRDSDRGIQFVVTINKQSHSYCIAPKVKASLQALESYGRKLHFRNQVTAEGQIIVAQTASKHGVSYEEAADMCCKLHFEILVEMDPEEHQPDEGSEMQIDGPVVGRNAVCPPKGKKTNILVKKLDGSRLCLQIDLWDTLEELKDQIFQRVPINRRQMRLLYAGKQMTEGYPLWEYGITNDSEVHILLRLKGGTKPMCELVPETNDIEPTTNETGDRGAICFGEKSAQEFGSRCFKSDKNFLIEPFVIELHVSPRYQVI